MTQAAKAQYGGVVLDPLDEAIFGNNAANNVDANGVGTNGIANKRQNSPFVVGTTDKYAGKMYETFVKNLPGYALLRKYI